MKKGFFLAVEGIDGAGKTTFISLLQEKLIEIQRDVFVCGSGEIPQLYSVLQELRSWTPPPLETIALIKMTGNSLNDYSIVRTNIKKGAIVIIDRYLLSLLAINVTLGLSEQWCKSLISCLTVPDLIVLLDISPEQAYKRKHDEDPLATNFGEGFIPFAAKVRKNFLKFVEEYNHIVFNSVNPFDKLVNDVIEIIDSDEYETNYQS